MKTDELPDRQPGSLPPWQEDELPAPLPFGLRNALKTIGPGAILLVGAIGMGEWIAGPLFVVQHGRGVLWIATLAFVLQSLLNLEAVRYTLYTGEPVITGLMRMRPGSRVWGTAYGLAACAQLGMPAAAAGCAGVAFALWQGRAPVDADHTPVTWITVALVVVATAVSSSG
jgi:Mn2+/Fe2+ NRAMP family transporter